MWLGALSCVGVGPSGWVAFVEWRGWADFGLIAWFIAVFGEAWRLN